MITEKKLTEIFVRTIDSDEDGIRLDRWFRRHFPDINHGYLQKLLRKGHIKVDGHRAKSNTRVQDGQDITIPKIRDNPVTKARKVNYNRINDNDIDLLKSSVIFKDDYIIAINKPSGLAVQGGSRTSKHVDAMLSSLQYDFKERPKLVHRLDKDTSGVLLLARTSKVASQLTKAFKRNEVHKIYWAIVVGSPQIKNGKVDLALNKEPSKFGDKMTVSLKGKRAVTYYRTVDNASDKVTWLAMMPKTGRTHQLRVHCSEIKIPILGDGKYGGTEAFLKGAEGIDKKLHLHAKAIKFPHPAGGFFQVVSDLSPHMDKAWKYFGFNSKKVIDPFEDFYEQWYNDHEE